MTAGAEEKLIRGVSTNIHHRFNHIDALRAVAVMMVVGSHAHGLDRVPGESGVTMFFVISGFIITYVLLRELEKTGGFHLGRFYFRRAAKLFPPLLVAVIVPTLVWALFNPLDWWAFAAQVFFAFNWVLVGTEPAIVPGSGVVWSLAVEEQFYIAFALIWLVLVRLPRPRRNLMLLGAIAAVGSFSVRLSLHMAEAPDTRIRFGTDSRLEAIAIGVFIAAALGSLTVSNHPRAVATRRALGHPAMLLAALLAFASTVIIRDEVFRDTGRFTLQAVTAALIIAYGFERGTGVIGRTFDKVASWRLVQLIGLSSYSIYLVHYILLYAALPVLEQLPHPAAALLEIVGGTAAGIAIYWIVELPVLRVRPRIERWILRTKSASTRKEHQP